MLQKVFFTTLIIFSIVFTTHGNLDDVLISGSVKDVGSAPISGATVALTIHDYITTTTDKNGEFSLTGQIPVNVLAPNNNSLQNVGRVDGGVNSIRFMNNTEGAKGNIAFFSVSGQKISGINLENLSTGIHSLPLPRHGNGVYIVEITLDNQITKCKLIVADAEVFISEVASGIETRKSSVAKWMTEALDTLVASKSAYGDVKLPIESFTMQNVEIVLEVICPELNLPSASDLTYNNDKLPDPFEFKFMDLPRVTTKALWECRRQEILAMAQKYLYGHMGPQPEVSGSVSNGTISVHCEYNGKSVDFSIKASGSGDILFVDFSMGAPAPSGARKCNVDPNVMLGHMRTLYGSTDAGLCMGCAWGVARIIDVLEQNPGEGIDATKVVTTGCSFAGKYAMAAGVFEPRVALCVPVESGACGTCSWRVSKEYGGGNSNTDCQDINTLETDWLGSVADPFRNGSISIKKLPFDQHEVMALRAPGGFMAFNNSKDWMWLCAKGNVAAAQGCAAIYKALGKADHFGFAESSQSHNHCAFPNEHRPQIEAFYKKFLDGDASADTDVMQWHPNSEETDKWFDWDMDVILE